MWRSNFCGVRMHYIGYFPRIVTTVRTSAVKSWALVLLSFSLISSGFLAILFTLTLERITSHRESDDRFVRVIQLSNDVVVCAGLLLGSVVFFAAALMGLLGSQKRRSFLIPHMVLESVLCIALIALTVVAMYYGGLSAGSIVFIIFGLNLGTVVSVWQYYAFLGKPVPAAVANPPTVILQPTQPVQIQYVGYTQLPLHPPSVARQPVLDPPPPYAETAAPVNGGYAWFRK